MLSIRKNKLKIPASYKIFKNRLSTEENNGKKIYVDVPMPYPKNR